MRTYANNNGVLWVPPRNAGRPRCRISPYGSSYCITLSSGSTYCWMGGLGASSDDNIPILSWNALGTLSNFNYVGGCEADTEDYRTGTTLSSHSISRTHRNERRLQCMEELPPSQHEGSFPLSSEIDPPPQRGCDIWVCNGWKGGNERSVRLNYIYICICGVLNSLSTSRTRPECWKEQKVVPHAK